MSQSVSQRCASVPPVLAFPLVFVSFHTCHTAHTHSHTAHTDSHTAHTVSHTAHTDSHTAHGLQVLGVPPANGEALLDLPSLVRAIMQPLRDRLTRMLPPSDATAANLYPSPPQDALPRTWTPTLFNHQPQPLSQEEKQRLALVAPTCDAEFRATADAEYGRPGVHKFKLDAAQLEHEGHGMPHPCRAPLFGIV